MRQIKQYTVWSRERLIYTTDNPEYAIQMVSTLVAYGAKEVTLYDLYYPIHDLNWFKDQIRANREKFYNELFGARVV